MSIQSRVQPGIPAGGQFAASTRSESEVDLAPTSPTSEAASTGQAPIVPPRSDPAFRAEDDLLGLERRARHDLSKPITARSLKLASMAVLRQYPNAGHLELTVSDEEDGEVWVSGLIDVDGAPIQDPKTGLVPDDVREVADEYIENLDEDSSSDWFTTRPDTWDVIHLDVRGAAAQQIPSSLPVPAPKRPAAELDDEIPRPQRSTAAVDRVMKNWVDIPTEDTDPAEVQEMREAALSDALADLRHWADSNGVDMFEAMDRSYRYYLADKEDQ
ncbi:MAG: hypothetical protein WKF57_06175 [Nakamurella sp.]